MNVQLLIDAIVRQTTVLIAQLATRGGVRAPLAHLANQVFLELAKELEAQGVSRKVSADMFGLALRSYQRKLRRLEESCTFRGRSLWEAVYSAIPHDREIPQGEILDKFRADDPTVIRGVLADLCETGLVFKTGQGVATRYRLAEAAVAADAVPTVDGGLDELVWALVFREGPISEPALIENFPGVAKQLDGVLARLQADGRVSRLPAKADEPAHFTAASFVVPAGAAQGWEASVYDHFHSVVQTICTKLEQGAVSHLRDRVGGSTYAFNVWPGHPYEAEVLQTLEDFRARHSNLRAKVQAYNKQAPVPQERMKVTVYAGQCVTELSEEKTDE
ncbi:MAG: hypothetical protein SF187_19555 [Deltaproteobacteria bacterium]|nr:hypothetical protein [Deltaproteobacteria bacterium]